MCFFLFRWTLNHHGSEPIGQAIRTQFRGLYHHYEEVPKDVQLKWFTYFKVIEYIFYELWYYIKVIIIFFYFCSAILLGHLRTCGIFKRYMRRKLENPFVICSPKLGPKWRNLIGWVKILGLSCWTIGRVKSSTTYPFRIKQIEHQVKVEQYILQGTNLTLRLHWDL